MVETFFKTIKAVATLTILRVKSRLHKLNAARRFELG